ncbi:hypothetical protein V5799_003927 [Amblyomma americanum]|uniref:Rna polymerase ii-associated protein 1 n=1 Tax=Amblyomma americanum TaxID=6943 RepID=A0AAQ4D7J9_AMBAM
MDTGLIRRPKRGETDEELMRMQEEFLRSGEKPSVQLVRAERKSADTTTTDSVTKSGTGATKAKTSTTDSSEAIGDRLRGLPSLVRAGGSDVSANQFPEVEHVKLESVLCDVIERSVSKDAAKPPSASTTPFPEPTKVLVCTLEGRKSLFASRLKKQDGNQRQITPKPTPEIPSSTVLSKDDCEAVHLENLGRLEAMSHDEKIKAQQELLSRLDPKTVAFLRSRRKPLESQASKREDANYSRASKDSPPDVVTSSTSQKSSGVSAALFSSKSKQEGPEMSATEADTAATVEYKEGCPAASATSVDVSDGVGVEAPVLNEDELPIKPSEAAKQWLNMSDVEKDKLQWMTMLPPVTAANSKDGAPCVGRFDFEGELVPPTQEVPVHKGLHHHGEQPEMAGYSSAEILRLLRSQVRSQRLFALQLLERILTKHWLGHYVGRLEGGDLLMQLLQSGLAPLVRSALDDKATVDAALAVLQALLVSQPQQALFGRAFLWRHGHRTFFLRPDTEYENASEIPDADFSQIDLVQALLRMDLLPRLHYVLKTFRPGVAGVASALLVMARMARHSGEAATKVLYHPHLMTLIFEDFLPAHWSSPAVVKGKMAEAYGNPMWPALELVRTIAAAGKELAEVLMQRYPLGQSLAAYLALEPSASQLPTTDCLNLALEALRTWRIFLAYGLGGDLCFDLYSVVARRLQLFSTLDLDGVPFDLEYGGHLLHCLAALPAHVTKSTLVGLSASLNFVCTRWLTLLARATDLQSVQTGVHTVAAMLHCLCSLTELGTPPDAAVVNAVLLVLKSPLSAQLASQLRTCSSLLAESEASESGSHSSKCLPCVTSEEPVPCTGWDVGSFELLAAMARLVRIAIAKSPTGEVVQNNTVSEELFKVQIALLCNAGVKTYLDQLCSHAKRWTRDSSRKWLCRPEFNLLFELALLGSPKALNEDDVALYHEMSLALVATCVPGFQWEYQKLLEGVVFASSFACSDSSTQSSQSRTARRLSSIKPVYLKTFTPIFRQHSESIVSLTPSKKPLFPCDWIYLPLHQLCALEENTRTYDRNDVLCCLHWVGHLLRARHRFMRAFPPLVHFTRLASVFLAGPELFLDMEVQGAMLSLLHLLEQTTLLCRTQRHLDLRDWPGMPSFSDFYLQLLEEYVGESYGDAVFACWVLVPLQGACDPHFRKLLFAENPEALAMTRLRPEQSVVPLSRFLEPPEENAFMLETYLKHLLSGRLDHARSPLLHTVAERSVARFVHSTISSHLKVHLLQVLSRQRRKEAAKRILQWPHTRAAS